MGEASGARSVGWQPCRACRPLRGDELVGTRPVADEGGGPSAATSEAKRAWLAKQAVPSWRSRLPSPYPLALTRTLALALTLTLTLILSPQDAYPYLLRMPYPTPISSGYSSCAARRSVAGRLPPHGARTLTIEGRGGGGKARSRGARAR